MIEEWSEWIEHDNLSWPKGVEPDQVVEAVLGRDGHTLLPMTARDIDWVHDDYVERYRKKIYTLESELVLEECLRK